MTIWDPTIAEIWRLSPVSRRAPIPGGPQYAMADSQLQTRSSVHSQAARPPTHEHTLGSEHARPGTESEDLNRPHEEPGKPCACRAVYALSLPVGFTSHGLGVEVSTHAVARAGQRTHMGTRSKTHPGVSIKDLRDGRHRLLWFRLSSGPTTTDGEGMPVATTLPQVNIVVRDMRASIAFYRLLGVEIDEVPVPEWAHHHANGVTPNGLRVELDSVAFAKQWNPGLDPERLGGSVLLFFQVPERSDVDALHDEVVEAGHRSLKAPEDAFWGSRYAILADPDGHGVGIMTASDPARRRQPPPPPG